MVGLRWEAPIFPSVVGDDIGDVFEVSTIRREVRHAGLESLPHNYVSLVWCAYILYSMLSWSVWSMLLWQHQSTLCVFICYKLVYDLADFGVYLKLYECNKQASSPPCLLLSITGTCTQHTMCTCMCWPPTADRLFSNMCMDMDDFSSECCSIGHGEVWVIVCKWYTAVVCLSCKAV